MSRVISSRGSLTGAIATLIVAGLLAALAVGSADAGTLYGLSSSTPGTVYTIDTATGAATPVVNLSGNNDTSIVGAEFLGGVLYATDVFSDSLFRFGRIDLTTGAFTPINDQDGSANWWGLAADETAGLFYTVDFNDGNKLKSITPGGQVTTIGSGIGTSAAGLAFDNANRILYGVDYSGSLFRIDTSTGLAQAIGLTGFSGNDLGLAYDESGQILYANAGNTGTLYTLNVTTGAATPVGPNGGAGIDGLAWLGAVRALDHYACRAVTHHAPVLTSRVLKLRDQFGLQLAATVAPELFCTPVSKNGEPIAYPRAHLTCYALDPQDVVAVDRRVEVTHQFGTQRFRARTPRQLCVPSAIGNTQIPTAVDHFLLYSLAGAPPFQRSGVSLADIFGSRRVTVTKAKLLGNPVDKEDEGIKNPDGHLVCHGVKGGASPATTVYIRNQFDQEELTLGRITRLCLPSTKRPL